jgi:uncharacterized protein YdaU (DUF1376 family)
MRFYSFHIGDYASHTRHLTLMEDLAYRRLLDLYYLHERPLNARSADVARAIGMRDCEAEVETVLTEFFEFIEGSGWINRRADEEIVRCKSKQEQASRAGKASAQRRFNARSTDVQPPITHDPLPITQERTSTDKSVEGGAGGTRAARADRGTRLPEDWEPSDEDRAFAASLGVAVEREAASFRDYWHAKPGADGRKTNWSATWRNWVRRSSERRNGNGSGNRRETRNGFIAVALELAEQDRNRAGGFLDPDPAEREGRG